MSRPPVYLGMGGAGGISHVAAITKIVVGSKMQVPTTSATLHCWPAEFQRLARAARRPTMPADHRCCSFDNPADGCASCGQNPSGCGSCVVPGHVVDANGGQVRGQAGQETASLACQLAMPQECGQRSHFDQPSMLPRGGRRPCLTDKPHEHAISLTNHVCVCYTLQCRPKDCRDTVKACIACSQRRPFQCTACNFGYKVANNQVGCRSQHAILAWAAVRTPQSALDVACFSLQTCAHLLCWATSIAPACSCQPACSLLQLVRLPGTFHPSYVQCVLKSCLDYDRGCRQCDLVNPLVCTACKQYHVLDPATGQVSW